MAFYLHRAFAGDPAVRLINGLRLEDPSQREHDGTPSVCQIDHLVLHRRGAVIVESKSVTGEIAVRGDGSGGDEWTRRFARRESGMPSPIRQAQRQAAVLRGFLQARRAGLLGRMPFGLRTISRLIAKTDRRGFRSMPIQIIVAISDDGRIRRIGKWKEPTKPFRTFVTKADLVADKIRGELTAHERGANPLGDADSDYGVWSMKPEELDAVHRLLRASHTPLDGQAAAPADPRPATEPVSRPDDPCCKHCGSAKLDPRSGRYGYFWACTDCGTNTSMPTVCSKCGTRGYRGQRVRIRKHGGEYFRDCTECGASDRVWPV